MRRFLLICFTNRNALCRVKESLRCQYIPFQYQKNQLQRTRKKKKKKTQDLYGQSYWALEKLSFLNAVLLMWHHLPYSPTKFMHSFIFVYESIFAWSSAVFFSLSFSSIAPPHFSQIAFCSFNWM